eukprot:762732-Hanusia_phi.AAC.1
MSDSGKTALVLSLCRHLREKYSLAVVTNDIFTKEDCEFLTRNEALEAERISFLGWQLLVEVWRADDPLAAAETGGCPHAAIREDISGNMVKLEELTAKFHPDVLFLGTCLGAPSLPLVPSLLNFPPVCFLPNHPAILTLFLSLLAVAELQAESGGDNLAANFSRELSDFTIYGERGREGGKESGSESWERGREGREKEGVEGRGGGREGGRETTMLMLLPSDLQVVDVAGGDKVPRKGGPGVTQVLREAEA